MVWYIWEKYIQYKKVLWLEFWSQCVQEILYARYRMWRDIVTTWLCQDSIGSIYDCAQAHRAPLQRKLLPDSIMPMDYSNCVHMIMRQLDWCKHKHALLLLAKRREVKMFNYCSAITSSIPSEIFRNLNFLLKL